MNNKKVIVCDLDGTLAISKSALGKDMAEVLCHVLKRHFLAVVSGGALPQFQKQFLSQLSCGPEEFQNLSLFPSMGASCYIFDKKNNNWKQVYDKHLTEIERKSIIKALNESIKESGMDLSGAFGEIIEDRGSQITFSGKGQNAPIGVKETWDPDRTKREKLVEILKKKIPQFEIRIGGSTSIDITHKGINKAYAVLRIKELLHVTDDDIIFVGDALYKGGNDETIKSTGVDFIQESVPNETIEVLSRYM